MMEERMASGFSSHSIAIDGPAGAGKSTVARCLALRLGMAYVDTGAMYRACALKAIRNGVPWRTNRALTDLMTHTQIAFRPVEGETACVYGGEDVSQAIRTPDVTRDPPTLPNLRCGVKTWSPCNADIAQRDAVVMDGRDIGSHVLPDAPAQIFPDCLSGSARALRRLRENKAKNAGLVEYEEVLADIRYRDLQDSTRAVSPLIRAQDAIGIDTSDIGIEEVVEIFADHIRQNDSKSAGRMCAMQISLAKTSGFCFGVDHAVKEAFGLRANRNPGRSSCWDR
jgi:cytidylate kinase